MVPSRALVAVLLLATPVAVAWALPMRRSAAQEAPKSDSVTKEPLDYFMQRKLGHSQTLFAALAVNDLPRASQEAQKLALLCLDEQWNVIQSPEYGERTQEFRRTIGALDKAARAKDLSGAQLDYLQLAGQCFACHKYVRDETPPRRK
jgi:cytochrome c556